MTARDLCEHAAETIASVAGRVEACEDWGIQEKAPGVSDRGFCELVAVHLLVDRRKWLREGTSYANVFVDDPPDMMIEPSDDAGTCPFLFRTRTRSLCAIHHRALETGRDVPSVKPAACRHWPLIVVPHGRGARITVHSSARVIGCVAPRADLPGHPTVREAFASEISELRGR